MGAFFFYLQMLQHQKYLAAHPCLYFQNLFGTLFFFVDFIIEAFKLAFFGLFLFLQCALPVCVYDEGRLKGSTRIAELLILFLRQSFAIRLEIHRFQVAFHQLMSPLLILVNSQQAIFFKSSFKGSGTQ